MYSYGKEAPVGEGGEGGSGKHGDAFMVTTAVPRNTAIVIILRERHDHASSPRHMCLLLYYLPANSSVYHTLLMMSASMTGKEQSLRTKAHNAIPKDSSGQHDECAAIDLKESVLPKRTTYYILSTNPVKLPR